MQSRNEPFGSSASTVTFGSANLGCESLACQWPGEPRHDRFDPTPWNSISRR